LALVLHPPHRKAFYNEHGGVPRGEETMSWFSNAKISTKLMGSFAVVALIAGVIGWTGLSGARNMAGVADDVYKNQLMPITEVETANSEFLEARLKVREAFLFTGTERDDRERGSAEHLRLLEESLAAYAKTQLSDEEKKLLPQLEAAIPQYKSARERVFSHLQKGDEKSAMQVMNTDGKAAADTAGRVLSQLTEIKERLALENNKKVEANAASVQLQIISFIVLGIVLALGLGYVIARIIANPVRKLASAADLLAVGDVNVELPGESKDEIGKLASSFRAMADNIRGRSEAAQKIAAGDMSVQVAAKSERDVLGHALKKCLEVLNDLMRQMDRMSKEHDAGDIDIKIDAQKFEGDYKKVAEGINGMVFGHISVKKKAMACLAEFGKGNFEAPLEKFPGKKAFINDTIEQLRANLKGLMAEMAHMSKQHDAGDIDIKIDAQKFEGDFGKVAQGINDMVFGHISVKKKAMACLAEFGRGNFEAPLEKFPGKKAFINDTFEQVRTNLKALIADATMLVNAAVEGKLATRADATRHNGDFRKIVEGVNQTLNLVVGPMNDFAAVLDGLAGGDLTLTVNKTYAGDFDSLKKSINTLAIQVRQAMQQIGQNTAALVASSEELNKVSQQMSSSADETAAQANVVSAASDQVSKNVQTVATGADEMGASIKEIAKNTADATKVAIAAVKTAETTNQTIEKLGQSSAEIGQVIKVITSIAQQTNLLALNATIEAARAGEAGKGFAVVANEVKELAKETAKATEDISQKIEAIQADTKGAVSAIAQISGVINQINDIQNTIASAVEEQSATTNEISRNLAEAAKGAVDITKNIGGVAEAARSTTSGAVDTQKSAQSLERMAAELQELVSQFKYDDQKGSVAKAAGSRNKANGKYVAPVTETLTEAVH
jgi:methyl-accepting chemotaxis protein